MRHSSWNPAPITEKLPFRCVPNWEEYPHTPPNLHGYQTKRLTWGGSLQEIDSKGRAVSLVSAWRVAEMVAKKKSGSELSHSKKSIPKA